MADLFAKAKQIADEFHAHMRRTVAGLGVTERDLVSFRRWALGEDVETWPSRCGCGRVVPCRHCNQEEATDER